MIDNLGEHQRLEVVAGLKWERCCRDPILLEHSRVGDKLTSLGKGRRGNGSRVRSSFARRECGNMRRLVLRAIVGR